MQAPVNELSVEHHMKRDQIDQALIVCLHPVIESALERLHSSLVHHHEHVQENHSLQLESWVL